MAQFIAPCVSPDVYYSGKLNTSQNIYLALVQSNYSGTNRGIADTGGGKAVVRLGRFTEFWNDEKVKTAIAHELGHVFGLYHDFSEKVIMAYEFEKSGGFGTNLAELDFEQFSERSKNWLSVHRDFSGYQFGNISVDNPMAIKVSPVPFGTGSGSVSPGGTLNLKSTSSISTGITQYKIYVHVSDPDGLHQVELMFPMLKDACCGPTYNAKNYALAKYLTANTSDVNAASYFTTGAQSWVGGIDITKWVKESFKRGDSDLDLHIAAIDSQGNISIFNSHNSFRITLDISADVNGDGVVNTQDLLAVDAAIGETGENDADVNDDGEVNIQDLLAVAAAIGPAAAAPSAIRQQRHNLTKEDVQNWLTQAQQLDIKSLTTQRGILFLQHLLAVLTPQETILLANYPNPFNPETWIPYQLAKPADVTLTIYDIKGSVVRALDLGHQRAGIYQSRSRAAYWDGRNAVGESVASGVYFYTFTAGEFTATRKMLILK